MKQGILPNEITIITPYLGQKVLLKKTEGAQKCIIATSLYNSFILTPGKLMITKEMKIELFYCL
jgi:hypothetical protein